MVRSRNTKKRESSCLTLSVCLKGKPHYSFITTSQQPKVNYFYTFTLVEQFKS